MPALKALRIKLDKQDDGEFELRLRDRAERMMVEVFLGRWRQNVRLDDFTQDEAIKIGELVDALPMPPEREKTQKEIAEEKVRIEADAARLQEFIAKGGAAIGPVRKDSSIRKPLK
jgi:hypothetical protein